MTILEKIKFEEDWLSEVDLTKENIKIAFAGIRATALEQQRNITNEEMYQQLIHLEAENERLHDALESQPQFYPPCIDCSTKMDEVRRAYDNLSKQRWIPVSEPPKEDGEYLVSRKNEENIWVEEAYYSTTSRTTFPKGFSIIKDNFSWRINNVIAWQPLPEPYSESEA